MRFLFYQFIEKSARVSNLFRLDGISWAYMKAVPKISKLVSRFFWGRMFMQIKQDTIKTRIESSEGPKNKQLIMGYRHFWRHISQLPARTGYGEIWYRTCYAFFCVWIIRIRTKHAASLSRPIPVRSVWHQYVQYVIPNQSLQTNFHLFCIGATRSLSSVQTHIWEPIDSSRLPGRAGSSLIIRAVEPLVTSICFLSKLY